MKPRLFLLDAVVIIHLHELGLWERVTQLAHVIVPGVVADNEVLFYREDVAGEPPVKHSLDLRAEAGDGRIEIQDADACDMAQTSASFPLDLRDGVHAGELEALTLLRMSSEPQPLFCTADRLAYFGLCHLGLNHLALSLEVALGRIGMAAPGGIRRQFRDATMKEWIKEGSVRAIQNRPT